MAKQAQVAGGVRQPDQARLLLSQFNLLHLKCLRLPDCTECVIFGLLFLVEEVRDTYCVELALRFEFGFLRFAEAEEFFLEDALAVQLRLQTGNQEVLLLELLLQLLLVRLLTSAVQLLIIVHHLFKVLSFFIIKFLFRSTELV